MKIFLEETLELKKISIDENYPLFIQKNKDILKDWIL